MSTTVAVLDVILPFPIGEADDAIMQLFKHREEAWEASNLSRRGGRSKIASFRCASRTSSDNILLIHCEGEDASGGTTYQFLIEPSKSASTRKAAERTWELVKSRRLLNRDNRAPRLASAEVKIPGNQPLLIGRPPSWRARLASSEFIAPVTVAVASILAFTVFYYIVPFSRERAARWAGDGLWALMPGVITGLVSLTLALVLRPKSSIEWNIE